jgi:hypothetical protein
MCGFECRKLHSEGAWEALLIMCSVVSWQNACRDRRLTLTDRRCNLFTVG